MITGKFGGLKKSDNSMIIRREFQLTSHHRSRPFAADVTFKQTRSQKPVIIFNHGFKGFKDWGPFPLVAEEFADLGFVFIKINFSHNGVTIDNPTEFADLESFSLNNFSIELDDTGVLIDALFKSQLPIEPGELDHSRLYIVGHSRGGASAILKAGEDARVKSVATWAAVSDLETRYSEPELEYWKEQGIIHILNARTNQQMPMLYQIVENYLANKERLDVPMVVKKLKIPMLSIHGSADATVPVEAVKQLKAWKPDAVMVIIEGADHTFGGGHPYPSRTLPGDLAEVVRNTALFFSDK